MQRERVVTAADIQRLIRGSGVAPTQNNPDGWEILSLTYQDFADVKEPKAIIDQIMREGEVVAVGASPKQAAVEERDVHALRKFGPARGRELWDPASAVRAWLAVFNA